MEQTKIPLNLKVTVAIHDEAAGATTTATTGVSCYEYADRIIGRAQELAEEAVRRILRQPSQA